MNDQENKNRSPINAGVLIIIIAFLLITPQIIMKSMIIGSDSLFHFNRFYDTASQIRNGNFQYFIHMYGFQQSGRIVNAFYGPMMAYLQGLLVLISSSWFTYQLLSNFILYIVSGFSMYIYLRKSSIKKESSLFISILFMTTFSIQYWIMRQGFSSWGAALLPLCLLPILQFKKQNTFNILEVGFFVALMTQVHLFTALLVVIIYFVYFMILFFKKKREKMKLLFSLFCSILFFFLLTLNIWYSMFTLYKGNTINPPFINKNIHLNTVTSNSYYWLINPLFLFLFIGLKLYGDRKKWQNHDAYDKGTSFLILLFFVLSTNLVPWKYLSTHHLFGIDFIQFPFRFFIPFTVLLLISCANLLNHLSLSSRQKSWFQLILFLSVAQVLFLTAGSSLKWKSDKPIPLSIHQFLTTENLENIKNSFFNKDKSISLELVQKSTPDYLPIYLDDSSNKYVEYEKYILNENEKYKKEIEKNFLVISWEGENLNNRTIPVIIYQNTNILFNNEILTANDMQVTSIGNPIVQDQKGKNSMKISYKNPRFFSIVFFLTISTWILYIGYTFLNLLKK